MPEPHNPSHDRHDPTRLEREFHETGWQPVPMRDPETGMPFTRWFSPAKPDPSLDFTTNYPAIPPSYRSDC